jgi:DNA segregation ATPase FtsK/SpoIIIE-like protein
MPQPSSRIDATSKWLTPSIADILDQSAPPPNNETALREMIAQLQEEFSALQTPVKVINIRPTQSYTLFILQPDVVGWLGTRRITPLELRRSAGQIADRRKDWRIGFLPKVDDAPDAVGLLVRTDRHRPLSLRRTLFRSAFRDALAPHSFVLGTTLDEQVIVRNLNTTPHLLIVGESTARQHLLSALLLTFSLFNTPSELLLVTAGSDGDYYAALNELPHLMQAVGNSPENFERALRAVADEMHNRYDQASGRPPNFEAYNAQRSDLGSTRLARIVVTLDPLTDDKFASVMSTTTPLLRDILINGAQVGIHVIAAVDKRSDLPSSIKDLFPSQVYLRSAVPNDFINLVSNWHNSLLRFTDAFIIDGQHGEVIPVELSAVSLAELRSAVTYWQSVRAQRGSETLSNLVRDVRDTGEYTAAVSTLNSAIDRRAALLAAYLGWVSISALRDIYGIGDNEAAQIIQHLQASGIIENGSSPMLRFIRLAERTVS